MQIECHERLNEAQIAEWRAFAGTSRHAHPRQDPRFAIVERAVGRTPLFVFGRRDGALCAVALLSLYPSRVPGRVAVASALSGPVCDDASTLVTFVRELSRNPALGKVDALRITPYWIGDEAHALARALDADGWARSDPEPARPTGIVDLTPDGDALRASFSRSARRKLRPVEESDIEIREVTDPAEAALFFERLNTLVLRHHGLTPVPEAEAEAAFAHVYTDPGSGVLFGAFHEGAFLGGLLLYRSHHTAHARRGVADLDAAAAASSLRVAPSLWLQGMLWAKDRGCTCLDVEGYRLVEDKSDPLFNVYEYKRQFRPQPVYRIAERTLPINKGFHFANEMPGRFKRSITKALPGVVARLKKARPDRPHPC